MDGRFTLILQQSGGSLSGSHQITGTLTQASGRVDLEGSGTLTGTVASGSNPSVSFTVRSGPCPSLTSDWSGSYASATGILTVTGTIHVITSTCVVLLTFPQTLVLRR
jgi:hypothetical protein